VQQLKIADELVHFRHPAPAAPCPNRVNGA
jgi:hypothetical protein